ncbi:hypothetical protein EDD11_009283 [Mortierella claussenii]|nr:hypothetical protein EDD11_009283 [Mortierella claussenii]
MSNQIFIIVFFSSLVVFKTIAIYRLIRSNSARRNKIALNLSRSPSLATAATGPNVLVEDPMTQRLLLSSSYGLTPSVVDITQPPPVYTTKDEHLEFINDPPPPPFSPSIKLKGSQKSKAFWSKGTSSHTDTIVWIDNVALPEMRSTGSPLSVIPSSSSSLSSHSIIMDGIVAAGPSSRIRTHSLPPSTAIILPPYADQRQQRSRSLITVPPLAATTVVDHM